MYLWKNKHYQVRLILWLFGIVVSVTLAQWLHELGHIVVALAARAPITEIRFWPPWDQHVVAEFDSLFWQKLGLMGGFLITAITFLGLFTLSALKKSKWAYFLVFPLFQTIPTSHGDFEALGLFIPFEISFFFGWGLPAITFVLLFFAIERKGKRPKPKKTVSQTGYLIHVTIRTKPLTRFLKYIPIPAFTGLYVCGHLFEISGFVENLGSQMFPGGDLKIVVTYAFGNLTEFVRGVVPAANNGEKHPIDFKGRDKWGVLAQGHALFLAKLVDSAGKDVSFYDGEARPLQQQPNGLTHIHSLYSLSRGELYTLIALLTSVVALCLNIVLKFI